MRPGQERVHSDTLGVIRSRNETVWTSPATEEFPYVTLVLARWMKQHVPDFPCTSISVNKDYAGRMHRDAFNAGPSVWMALGDFAGGCLEYWPDDDRRVSEAMLQNKERPQVLDAKVNTVMFDGCRAHAVSPFEGRRYSLVFFTTGSWDKCDDETMSAYSLSSFTWPTGLLRMCHQPEVILLHEMLRPPWSQSGLGLRRRRRRVILSRTATNDIARLCNVGWTARLRTSP